MASILILGAKGRFGRAATHAFSKAGWRVTALARSWDDPDATVSRITADVCNEDALIEAAKGHDVIMNAVHPPYPAWAVEVPKITKAIIAAARQSGATVMIPGNVYNYGDKMPEVLQETTPWQSKGKKGNIRIRMERAYQDAGVRTIVLRSGDFIEPERTGNWFDTHIAINAWNGKFTYPGPLDIVHAWAYLPDAARAMVGLAEQRDKFQPFEEFGFSGISVTGMQLVDAVSDVVKKPMRISGMPWFAIRMIALVSPLMREVLEMRYLWNVPHRIDGTKLKEALPGFEPTPLATAIEACLVPHAPKNLALERASAVA